MASSKYNRPLLVAIVIVVAITIMIGVPLSGSGNQGTYFRLMPDIGGAFPAVYMFSMYVVLPIIGGLIGCYLLAPLFLGIFKKVIGRKNVFGIEEKPVGDKFTERFRGFFPALMAINFSLLLCTNESVQAFSVNMDRAIIANLPSSIVMVFSVFPMTMLTIFISSALFSAMWSLLEAGVVFSNKNEVKDTVLPDEVHSVGGWYEILLSGYAGISVLFAYYQFVVAVFSQGGLEGPSIVILPILPFLLTAAMVPTVVVLDVILPRRRKFVVSFAKRIGITEFVKVGFEARPGTT